MMRTPLYSARDVRHPAILFVALALGLLPLSQAPPPAHADRLRLGPPAFGETALRANLAAARREKHPGIKPIRPAGQVSRQEAARRQELTRQLVEELSRQNPNPARVVYLVSHGADVNATGRKGETAWWWCIRSEAEKRDKKVDDHGAMVKALLRAAPNIDLNARCWGETALTLAAGLGLTDTVATLLKMPGIDVNAKDGLNGGWSALMWAANGHFLEMVKALVQKGADVNAKSSRGDTPITLAIEDSGAGDITTPDIVKVLVQKGADVNARIKGRPVLMIAASSGREHLVEELLRVPGIDVNARDDEGNTALIWASKYNFEIADSFMNSPSVVEELLRVPGINVNARNDEGKTALQSAQDDINDRVLRHETPDLAITQMLKAAGATDSSSVPGQPAPTEKAATSLAQNPATNPSHATNQNPATKLSPEILEKLVAIESLIIREGGYKQTIEHPAPNRDGVDLNIEREWYDSGHLGGTDDLAWTWHSRYTLTMAGESPTHADPFDAQQSFVLKYINIDSLIIKTEDVSKPDGLNWPNCSVTAGPSTLYVIEGAGIPTIKFTDSEIANKVLGLIKDAVNLAKKD